MPRDDGTGPIGMGQMTGRGAGYCACFKTPGFANPAGLECAFRGGHGFRRMFYATGLPGRARFDQPAYAGAYEPNANEKELLSRQAVYLEKQLQQVKKRLSTFKGDAE